MRIKLTEGEFKGRIVEAKAGKFRGVPTYKFTTNAAAKSEPEKLGRFVVPQHWADVV